MSFSLESEETNKEQAFLHCALILPRNVVSEDDYRASLAFQ